MAKMHDLGPLPSSIPPTLESQEIASLLARLDAVEGRLASTDKWAETSAREAAKQAERVGHLMVERDKLQAFKDWVHSYLDSKGVPHHPPGTHGAAGCRIGDRMDWLLAERDALAARVREFEAAIRDVINHDPPNGNWPGDIFKERAARLLAGKGDT